MHVAPLVVALAACQGTGADAPSDPTPAVNTADVVGVRVTGSAHAYTFDVTIRSDETGCDRYADWWEVLTADGALVFRRILDHSHPDEQPFTRGGGPVDVGADDALLVRAHLHPDGYGGAVMAGSAGAAFAKTTVASGFAADLAAAAPLPEDCLF
jgi:hypothetical protein